RHVTGTRGGDGVPYVASTGGPLSVRTLRVEFGGFDDVCGLAEREQLREILCQCGPALNAVFQRERVLDIPQSGLSRCLRIGAAQPRTCPFVIGAQSFEPALRFLLQIVEGTRRSELS